MSYFKSDGVDIIDEDVHQTQPLNFLVCHVFAEIQARLTRCTPSEQSPCLCLQSNNVNVRHNWSLSRLGDLTAATDTNEIQCIHLQILASIQRHSYYDLTFLCIPSIPLCSALLVKNSWPGCNNVTNLSVGGDLPVTCNPLQCSASGSLEKCINTWWNVLHVQLTGVHIPCSALLE